MNSIYSDKNLYRIVITPGEPAGIGPDIVIMAVQKSWPTELIICADTDLLLSRSKQLNLPLKLKPYCVNNIRSPSIPGEASILHISLNNTAIPGKLDTKNSTYLINTLKIAAQGCLRKEFLALVTGPVNKAIINQSGISFIGHTEFFSKMNNNSKTVMMFNNNYFRIALATTHIPISSVSKSITAQSICNTINILVKGLQKYFDISYPKIYVCGLNPHSGESGYIGREEIDIIIPTLNHLRQTKKFNIIGPLPADTIFQEKYLNNSDVILAMYHDQGLPVLKYSNFDQSVNITLGLPFIRTSVGHGSAIELAGKINRSITANSMNQAIITSINMIHRCYGKTIL